MQSAINLILDVPIFIFGIFVAGNYAREIYDPYAKFGDHTIFAT